MKELCQIEIINAYENNLKNLTVEIPLNKFTCLTGPSGCGKSSLIYDTIYAESQRNFLESMSGNMYGQKLMDKPKVDEIRNLCPALNVSQNYYNHNPRSTIGTLTDISYYLRTLFALIINEETGSNYSDSYFSFNHPNSCCKHCKGLGEEYVISEDLLIPDKNKSLSNGAISYYKGKDTSVEKKLLLAICEYFGIDPDTKFKDLTTQEKQHLLYREETLSFEICFKTPKGRYKKKTISQKGVMPELKEKLNDIDTPSTFLSISKFLSKDKCSFCEGTKLDKMVLEKTVCDKSIADIENLQISEINNWIYKIDIKYQTSFIYKQISQLLSQISKRVERLVELKVDYLSLNRSIPTLSGGEVQRIRIANQLNCSLRGLIYILDEPCKGLHNRNIDSIITATNSLVSKGNTVIAIEHNKKYISCADKIIELGPVGGPDGGYLISDNKRQNEYEIKIKFKKPQNFNKFVSLKNINYRNIRNQSTKFPIGAITCVTGVSGSGKSTLVSAIEQCIEQKRNILCDKIEGLSYITKVNNVNQKPIGKTPRSTVISYLEIYDNIRNLFAETPGSKKNGLTVSDFSMNVTGGRCECCQGTGMKKIKLNYLPDSYVTCPDCRGKRFNKEILEIKYKDMTINDVLDTPISEIIFNFRDNAQIYEKLKCMIDIGLGYIKLGQMSMTLSGGEAQRIKLARALGVKSTGKNLYILDEPTSGLSEKDIDIFCDILFRLQEQGETIIIIEHNIEFISKMADYMIDFGLTAGNQGGIIVSQGSPYSVYTDGNSSWN